MSKKKKTIRAKLIANPRSGNALENTERLEKAVRYLTEHGIKVDVAFASPKEEGLNIAKNAVKMVTKLILLWVGMEPLERSLGVWLNLRQC